MFLTCTRKRAKYSLSHVAAIADGVLKATLTGSFWKRKVDGALTEEHGRVVEQPPSIGVFEGDRARRHKGSCSHFFKYL